MSVDISAIYGQKKKQAEADQANAARASSGRLWTVPDDFPDLQTAIDNVNAGDGIFLLPGASPYILTNPLCISKPLHILGVDDVGESAVVTFQTSVNYLPLLRVTASNVRIKGVTLQSAYVAPASTTPGAAVVTTLSSTPAETHGKKTQAVVTTSQNQKNEKASSSLVLPPLDPASPRFISVHVSNGAQNVVFDECVIRCTGGMHGVFLSPDSYTTMVCCSVTSTLGCALYSDARLYVDRCDFSSSALGLLVSQNSHVQVKSSCFTQCDQGLMIDGHGFVDVNVCAFSNCRVGMISCADLPPPKVSLVRGCEFMDCTTTSLFISGVEAALDVQKNFFHGTCRHAILLHDASQRVEIRANAFRGLSGIGVRVFAGAPIIECNVFEGCRRAAVVVESSRPTIRLNEFVRNRKNAAVVNAGVAHPSAHQTREQFSVAIMVDGETVSRSLTTSASRELIDEHYTNQSVPINGPSTSSQPSTPSGQQRRAAAAAAASSPSRGGTRVVSSENANSILALRGAIAAANRAAVNVMHTHPDPHVEGNLFAENDINLWVALGCGTYVKNELLSSFEQSVVVEGGDSVFDRLDALTTTTTTAPSTSRGDGNMENSCRTTLSAATSHSTSKPSGAAAERKALLDATFRLPEFPTSISHNELRGSVSSHVIHCLPGAFASIIQNQISHAAKGFGVLVETSRFVELKQNTLSECQGGIQARGEGATGKIVTNDMGGLSLYVQSDATRTMLVGHNTNVQQDSAE